MDNALKSLSKMCVIRILFISCCNSKHPMVTLAVNDIYILVGGVEGQRIHKS